MIARQRKSHKFIWLAIALIAPILVFFAIKDLPLRPSNQGPGANIEFEYADSYKEAENEFISMVFNRADESYLELYVKKPLKSASSVVYALDNGGNKAHVLGNISGVGKYRFEAEIGTSGVLIYDVLKSEQVLKLSF